MRFCVRRSERPEEASCTAFIHSYISTSMPVMRSSLVTWCHRQADNINILDRIVSSNPISCCDAMPPRIVLDAQPEPHALLAHHQVDKLANWCRFVYVCGCCRIHSRTRPFSRSAHLIHASRFLINLSFPSFANRLLIYSFIL